MGRGRAKAKQVKVARQLKYNSGGTDLDRLRAELGVGSDQRRGNHDDPYAAYDADAADEADETDEDADDEDDEDEDEDDWSRR
jgi:TATA-binding protein-associated factor Taf7